MSKVKFEVYDINGVQIFPGDTVAVSYNGPYYEKPKARVQIVKVEDLTSTGIKFKERPNSSYLTARPWSDKTCVVLEGEMVRNSCKNCGQTVKISTP